MKIHAQDNKGVYEFGSVFIPEKGLLNTVRVCPRGGDRSYFLGIYEDEARAKGVILDIETAYYQGLKLYHMPLE